MYYLQFVNWDLVFQGKLNMIFVKNLESIFLKKNEVHKFLVHNRFGNDNFTKIWKLSDIQNCTITYLGTAVTLRNWLSFYATRCNGNYRPLHLVGWDLEIVISMLCVGLSLSLVTLLVNYGSPRIRTIDSGSPNQSDFFVVIFFSYVAFVSTIILFVTAFSAPFPHLNPFSKNTLYKGTCLSLSKFLAIRPTSFSPVTMLQTVDEIAWMLVWPYSQRMPFRAYEGKPTWIYGLLKKESGSLSGPSTLFDFCG